MTIDAVPTARFWPIKPTPWVRESNRDKWAPRARVQRYRAFRKECFFRKVWPPRPGDLVVFMMPMPSRWSRVTRIEMDGLEHEQVPDVDNLLKALLDALYPDDSQIWMVTAAKVWSQTPGIYIERRLPIDLPFRPLAAA